MGTKNTKKTEPKTKSSAARGLAPDPRFAQVGVATSLRAQLAASGVVANVEVVASPRRRASDPPPTGPIAQELALFRDRLNEVGPSKALRSAHRVDNASHLHDCLMRKFNAVIDQYGIGAVLSFDDQEPLELLHYIDPGNPDNWYRIRGTGSYGGNVYEVELDDGSFQSLAIQYVGAPNTVS
ncbi:hypothetical protein Pla163_13850 [Planctomycetes bacterium Pla163]|uniref:Uncharacterized protein n=1 Tax=Rohdeia mirabilis TaxID=2528008 RepID=A0A518CYH0_9BACT|nr:hypothetical protein Pla163_13850 [Planctomycetes bacterium Pla163]